MAATSTPDVESEEHVLLQVPDELGRRLDAWLAGEDDNLKLDVAMGAGTLLLICQCRQRRDMYSACVRAADCAVPVVHADGKATIRIDGNVIPSALRSLPTVVETHKSLDGVNFFKSGEVGQVLVVGGSLPEGGQHELADGLTPPLAGVRKRKWRTRPNEARMKV